MKIITPHEFSIQHENNWLFFNQMIFCLTQQGFKKILTTLSTESVDKNIF